MRSKLIHSLYLPIIAISFAFFLTQCTDADSNHESHSKHWSYSGETGPNHWADLNKDYALAAEGKSQSPIDISSASVTKSDLPNIQFHYEAAEYEVENNGHTIEAIPQSGNYVEIKGVKFNLLQFHFHSESEHTVDGNHYPLEVHFVHKNADGNLAVIGLFIKPGKENQNFKPIWDNLPQTAGTVTEVQTKINAGDLLPSDMRSYQYSGSLTTPPCTEGVSWFVVAQPVEMSQAQIDAFKTIYNHNFRPVQEINERNLVFDVSK